MAAPVAAVLRDGLEVNVPARDVVPGDVVLLRAGNRVPADARIVEAVQLEVEEAALTGESVPVEKHADVVATPESAIGDRRNMAHAGTIVTRGRGQAVVVATGMGTEFGRVAELLETVDAGRTPLQESLDQLGATLARVAFVVVAAIVALGLLRAQPSSRCWSSASPSRWPSCPKRCRRW